MFICIAEGVSLALLIGGKFEGGDFQMHSRSDSRDLHKVKRSMELFPLM